MFGMCWLGNVGTTTFVSGGATVLDEARMSGARIQKTSCRHRLPSDPQLTLAASPAHTITHHQKQLSTVPSASHFGVVLVAGWWLGCSLDFPSTCQLILCLIKPPTKSQMFSLRSISRVARPSALEPRVTTPQRRWNWQIYLKQRVEKGTGKLKYDDWDRVIMTMKEPRLADGTSLVRRSQMRDRHVKPTTRNKLIQQRKEYRRQIKRIDDLTNYIQFMNEAKK